VAFQIWQRRIGERPKLPLVDPRDLDAFATAHPPGNNLPGAVDALGDNALFVLTQNFAGAAHVKAGTLAFGTPRDIKALVHDVTQRLSCQVHTYLNDPTAAQIQNAQLEADVNRIHPTRMHWGAPGPMIATVVGPPDAPIDPFAVALGALINLANTMAHNLDIFPDFVARMRDIAKQASAVRDLPTGEGTLRHLHETFNQSITHVVDAWLLKVGAAPHAYIRAGEAFMDLYERITGYVTEPGTAPSAATPTDYAALVALGKDLRRGYEMVAGAVEMTDVIRAAVHRNLVGRGKLYMVNPDHDAATLAMAINAYVTTHRDIIADHRNLRVSPELMGCILNGLAPDDCGLYTPRTGDAPPYAGGAPVEPPDR